VKIPLRWDGETAEHSGGTVARVLRTIGLLFGFVALAAPPAVGLGAFAAADSGPSPSTNSTPRNSTPRGSTPGDSTPGAHVPRHRAPLTDEQRQCLAEHGVTLPVRPVDGRRGPPPSQADRDTLRAAAEACGLPVPVPHGERRII
jgi:hypothetical protein